ncbi:hypothetical protein Tco_0833806, partial [Tanacetum coccineum]
KMLWADSVSTAYLIYRIPYVPIGLHILEEEWQGKDTSLTHLKLSGYKESLSCPKQRYYFVDLIYEAKSATDSSSLTKPIQKSQVVLVDLEPICELRYGESGALVRYSPSANYLLLTENGEPDSYSEALGSKESVQWKNAIIKEMVSLKMNKACSLVRLLAEMTASQRLWMSKVKEEHNSSEKVSLEYCRGTKSSIHLVKNLKVCSGAKLVWILISEGSLSLLKILGTKSLAKMFTRLVMNEKLKFCTASTGLRVNCVFPVEDSDSLMVEIDTFLTSDDSIPPRTDSEGYDSEEDNIFLEYELDPGELTRVVMEDIFGEPNVLNTHPTLCQDLDFTLSTNFSGSDLVVSFPSGNRNNTFDPGISIEVQSKRFLSLNKFSISFISDLLSPVLENLLQFSTENEDKVFNPRILVSNEEKSPHLLSHRGFKAFKIIHNFLNESPMMIYEGHSIGMSRISILLLDQLKYKGSSQAHDSDYPDYEESRGRGFVQRSLDLHSFACLFWESYILDLID